MKRILLVFMLFFLSFCGPEDSGILSNFCTSRLCPIYITEGGGKSISPTLIWDTKLNIICRKQRIANIAQAYDSYVCLPTVIGSEAYLDDNCIYKGYLPVVYWDDDFYRTSYKYFITFSDNKYESIRAYVVEQTEDLSVLRFRQDGFCKRYEYDPPKKVITKFNPVSLDIFAK